ncbi:hypothetical protein FGD64_03640 [Candidatus Liberibacter asiaticus]|uniref:hypothetical protein n=1 Tax=Liberibacter asiaticus TaxID=34021 RepID=UPI0015DCA0B3|nr:hypothetical protein [Candidatus Liberibacter asiaticus]QLK10391.1 hypothetical protein FGD64_03640 [Candidatus Liberibacter asiaticus]
MAISYRYRYSPNFTQRRWRRRPYTSSRRARPFNTYSRMNMYRRRLQPAYGSSRIVSPYRIRIPYRFNRPYKRLPYNRRRRPYFARSRRRRPFNRWRRRPYTWRRRPYTWRRRPYYGRGRGWNRRRYVRSGNVPRRRVTTTDNIPTLPRQFRVIKRSLL